MFMTSQTSIYSTHLLSSSFDDFEDYVNPNSPVYRNCVCLSCLIQNFLSVYASMFRRGDVHSIPSSVQGAASSTASLDNSLSDIYRSPPRPLPYDAEPRYFRLQRDGLVSRREKGSSHSNEETEPLRSDVDVDPESSNSGDKWNESACEAGSKVYRSNSKSSLRLSSTKYSTGVGLVYASSEEEDVCPTCLEEYTKENPKIMTKCAHHFHLGCIYEWMERSDNCPVCGKLS
ncbi:E3 ubiquitin-protein ligase [Mucuna pruriens]|uniref:RING-type E3 ubiquitin transferase n=1 Tax=Mucuna pruriens TaxID=157652 RepID=A0A371FNS1_MUCPR|nr:E3 ubiquitin-protein ligase [Mucuna pruriens]